MYDTSRPHNERFAKLVKAEKLLAAKHLGVTRPELDRIMLRRQRVQSIRLQAYVAERDAQLRERDALRTWLGAFGDVLWSRPEAAVSDDVSNDAHP